MSEVGLDARADRVFVVRALDGLRDEDSDVEAHETRRRGRLWVTLGPERGLRWQLSGGVSQRSGALDHVASRHIELRFATGLSAAF
jgi:hypothetical protein